MTSGVATLSTGYTGFVDGGHVGLIKAINAKITPASMLVAGTRYTVATVSYDFKPKVFASAFAIANNSIAYCDISSITGEIVVRPTSGDVPAGVNIWLRCTYI